MPDLPPPLVTVLDSWNNVTIIILSSRVKLHNCHMLHTGTITAPSG